MPSSLFSSAPAGLVALELVRDVRDHSLRSRSKPQVRAHAVERLGHLPTRPGTRVDALAVVPLSIFRAASAMSRRGCVMPARSSETAGAY